MAGFDQPDIGDTAEFRENVIRGGYWYLDLRNESGYQPGRNAASVFGTGPVIVEAERASNALRERGIFVNVCNVTSWERLKRALNRMYRDNDDVQQSVERFLEAMPHSLDRVYEKVPEELLDTYQQRVLEETIFHAREYLSGA